MNNKVYLEVNSTHILSKPYLLMLFFGILSLLWNSCATLKCPDIDQSKITQKKSNKREKIIFSNKKTDNTKKCSKQLDIFQNSKVVVDTTFYCDINRFSSTLNHDKSILFSLESKKRNKNGMNDSELFITSINGNSSTLAHSDHISRNIIQFNNNKKKDFPSFGVFKTNKRNKFYLYLVSGYLVMSWWLFKKKPDPLFDNLIYIITLILVWLVVLGITILYLWLTGELHTSF